MYATENRKVNSSQNNSSSISASKRDNGPMSTINTTIGNQPSSVQLKNPNVMKKPRENPDEIADFFLYQFKCLPCQLKKGTCEDKSTCERWHHEGERRRNPGVGPNYLYSEEPCPKVKVAGTNRWSKPTNCENGDACPFSHTLMEQMYHPNIYKTSLCANFASSNGDQCQWGFFCTHAHGQKEIRNSNKTNTKKQPANNKQKHPNNKKNVSETKNDDLLKPASDLSRSFQNQSNTDVKNNHINQQTHASSLKQNAGYNSSGSPSRLYNISSHQISDFSSKFPPLSVNGSSKKPSKVSHSSFSTSHTHAITPNTTTYEQPYYEASQTFPNHLQNEYQQQYSWDVGSNDISNTASNLQMPSTYTAGDNFEHSPPPISTTTSYDLYHASNTSPSHSPESHNQVGQTYASSMSTNSSQIPKQLPRPRSLNIQPSNSKLQVIIPSNPPNNNQYFHHMTPPYTVGHAPKYPVTSIYQPYTPQIQVINGETTSAFKENNNVHIWPTTLKSGLNNAFGTTSLQPINDTPPQQQPLSFQSPSEMLPTNANNIPILVPNPNPNLNPNLPSNLDSNFDLNPSLTSINYEPFLKDTRDDVSFYFWGEDSLLSPLTSKPMDITTPKRNLSDLNTCQSLNEYVSQLKSQINDLKKELEIVKEKNIVCEEGSQKRENANLESEVSQNKKNKENKMENTIIQEHLDLFEKYMNCPNCHKNILRDNVLIPCGHLVCDECIPQKDGKCPICMTHVNENSQKVFF